jgi:peptide/nickel transport system substrate-binding protein
MQRIRLRQVIVIAIAAVLLQVQAISMISPANAQDRPVLRLGTNAADLSTLDPHFASGTQDRTVVDMIFNGLVRFAPGDSSTIEPDIATEIPEPEMDGDQQVWTFTIRDGVMCHPWEGGESYQLTAADVVYSLEKAANPDTSGYSADYAGMSFEQVDDMTVRITVANPLSPTLFLPKVANYNGGFVVCSQAVEALGLEGFQTQPVGTGPFMFS